MHNRIHTCILRRMNDSSNGERDVAKRKFLEIHFVYGTVWYTVRPSKFWGERVAGLTFCSWEYHLELTAGFSGKTQITSNLPSTPETTLAYGNACLPWVWQSPTSTRIYHTSNNVTCSTWLCVPAVCTQRQRSHFSLGKLCTCLGVFNMNLTDILKSDLLWWTN